jgi:hypothetical protein
MQRHLLIACLCLTREGGAGTNVKTSFAASAIAEVTASFITLKKLVIYFLFLLFCVFLPFFPLLLSFYLSFPLFVPLVVAVEPAHYHRGKNLTIPNCLELFIAGLNQGMCCLVVA